MRWLVAFLLMWPGLAGAMELACTATRVCVAGLDVTCDEIAVDYRLDPGTAEGDKLVLTAGDGERFYEFRRLGQAEGVLVQAAGGALEPGQGAGAMTVFDDLRFVLSRQSLIAFGGEGDAPARAVSISLHGACERRD